MGCVTGKHGKVTNAESEKTDSPEPILVCFSQDAASKTQDVVNPLAVYKPRPAHVQMVDTLTLRQRYRGTPGRRKQRWERQRKPSISVDREQPAAPPLPNSQPDNHSSREKELQVLCNGKLSERVSRKEQPIIYPSKDQRTLEDLMDRTQEIVKDVEKLRNALSDHAQTSLTVPEIDPVQGTDLEKKLSAEIDKEKEVNKSLRDFKDGSEVRKSERRLSIAANRISLHVIPEHQDEPTDPESYQYSETNIYF